MIRLEPIRALALGVLVLTLTSCGGSGSPAPVIDDDTGVLAQPVKVLVRPAEGEDVVDIAKDSGSTKIKEVPGTKFFAIEFPDQESAENFSESIDGDTRVLDRELDRIVSSPEGGGATLPAGSELFEFSVVPNQPELMRIGVDVARSRATGAGMRVAVIDSGVVATHISMQGRIEPGGWDFVDNDDDPTDVMNGLDDDGDGLIDEGFGHGTFVSSLILAIAPDAMILPFRVLDSDSNGVTSQVAEAITRATDAGVDVINLSLGMEHQASVIGSAMGYARDHGVLVVASAGNTSSEEITFPATIGIAMAVASVDSGDIKCDFSSFGGSVDLAAPGLELLGAYPVDDVSAVKWSGTSFSAALATGCYVLVRELLAPGGPSEGVAKVYQSLDEVTEIVNPEFVGLLGSGRLDLAAATDIALE